MQGELVDTRLDDRIAKLRKKIDKQEDELTRLVELRDQREVLNRKEQKIEYLESKLIKIHGALEGSEDNGDES